VSRKPPADRGFFSQRTSPLFEKLGDTVPLVDLITGPATWTDDDTPVPYVMHGAPADAPWWWAPGGVVYGTFRSAAERPTGTMAVMMPYLAAPGGPAGTLPEEAEYRVEGKYFMPLAQVEAACAPDLQAARANAQHLSTHTAVALRQYRAAENERHSDELLAIGITASVLEALRAFLGDTILAATEDKS